MTDQLRSVIFTIVIIVFAMTFACARLGPTLQRATTVLIEVTQ